MDTAVEELKRATRRYAKRQMTWFCARDYVDWIDMIDCGEVISPERAVTRALSLIDDKWK